MPMPKPLPHEPATGPDGHRFWHPKIELWPIKKVRPSKRNARTHSKKQREKLLAIIRRFGFINPIIIDENGTVIAGHLRLEVAGLLGMTHVPIIQVTHLTDLDTRALALAEKIALLSMPGGIAKPSPLNSANWRSCFPTQRSSSRPRDSTSRRPISLLPTMPNRPETGLRISCLTRDLLLAGCTIFGSWQGTVCIAATLGTRRAYATLMCGDSATMVFTDPPYNVSIRTHARGRSRICLRGIRDGLGRNVDPRVSEIS